MSEEFDVIVLGAGPAGEHAVGRATKAGLKTAIVESELFGGECSYWACIPSKTLLRPGRVIAAAQAVPGAREAVTGVIDSDAALARRDSMTSDWDDQGQLDWVIENGATPVRGRARITGEKSVVVESTDGSTRLITADKAVIIATGSSPLIPPIPGLAESRHWDNRGATSAKQVPERLIVLGGGAQGAELAQAWKRLGAREVTIIDLAERLISTSEPFAGELVAHALEKEGIDLRLGRRAEKVERESADAPVFVTLDDQSVVAADELLVAVGRRPRTNDLGLESLGLDPSKPIEVDRQLRVVGVPGAWLYAIGDVNGEVLLTHMGKYQARIAVRSIVGEEVEDIADHRAISAVVFTDPQVATVGLTEAAALQAGIAARSVRVELSAVAAGSIEGEDVEGAAQLVIDTEASTVVGATFVGPDFGELVHAATIAVIGKVKLEELRHAVAAFPTLSELWLELVESYFLDPSDN